MLDKTLFHRHLEEEESAMMIVHKHWLLGVKHLFWPTALFLLPWLVLAVSRSRTAFYVIAAVDLVSVILWMRNFFDFYLDAWIITDQGVIALEWKGWFHRESSRILYSDIQGISYETHGIAGTVFRYGTVTLEKISTGAAVSIDHVPRPRSVEATILKNMEAYLHAKNLKNEKHVQEILAGFVAEHLQKEGVSPGKKKETPATGTPEKSPSRKRSFHSSKISSSHE